MNEVLIAHVLHEARQGAHIYCPTHNTRSARVPRVNNPWVIGKVALFPGDSRTSLEAAGPCK